MRFFHLADLHIGKRLNEFELLDDQQHILRQIIELAAERRPQAIVIAGDVYDKAAPAAEAYSLYDQFITELARLDQPLLLISGNHDSPERLGCGSRIMAAQNVHIAGVFSGTAERVAIADGEGETLFWLLPFVRPAQVRRYYPEQRIDSYDEALRTVLQATPPVSGRLNVLVAHQFVTAAGLQPERSDSEQISVGGLDNIDAGAFCGYDYVALGHLHRAQSIGAPHIRYAGSPLKYSFSEATQQKSLTEVELHYGAEPRIELLPLTPRRDLREIRGSLEQLTQPEVYQQADTADYLHVTLTDEADLLDPLGVLRAVYPNIMRLDYDNSRYAEIKSSTAADAVTEKSAEQLFRDFYKLQQNIDLEPEKEIIVSELLQRLRGER
ncbi:MAG: exonuclease SbcCD subunit D [Bacillota bacterium]|nr:exonuclease SbcCD subunit D [Bacillota bacterium]